jgi:hypothetical protein
MSDTVFLLGHDFSTNAQPDNGRYIGAYSSRSRAEVAKHRIAQLPGYKDFPDGFTIDEYRLGEDHWTSGFAKLS